MPSLLSRFAAPALLALVLAACSRGPAKLARPADALAQVGDEYITVAQFDAALARRRATGAGAEVRRAVLDDLIRFRAEVQEARRRGLERDPEVVAALERLLAAKVREQAQEADASALTVAPEEIEAAYALEAERQRAPARLRLAQLVVEAPAAAAPALRAERREKLAEARARAAALAPGAGYGALAAEISYDQASKFRGGDLGYLTESSLPADWPREVQQAALALRSPGEQSEILEIPQGYLLLRLTERAEGQPPPPAQIRASLQARLGREKQRAAEIARQRRLAESVRIEIDEARWRALPVPASTVAQRPAPPAAPADGGRSAD